MAVALTKEFVNECIDNELIVQWGCMESNTASKIIAESAGFQFLKKGEVIGLVFYQARPLAPFFEKSPIWVIW